MSRGKSLHIGLNYVNPDAYGGWDGELNGCINDANGMQGVADSLGYESQILTDGQATSTRVLQEISGAARELQSGDIFFLTYSGHGGQVYDANSDEADAMDETWVLYDREVVDDELYALWSQFAPGVRIIVLSDSCHSGTVAKMMMAEDILEARKSRRKRSKQGSDTAASPEGPRWEDKAKAMPREYQQLVNEMARDMYDQVQYIAGPSRDADVRASVLLISGCQDNQLSYDGNFYGQFTGTLLQVWDNGSFQDDYASFHRAIQDRMPPEQTPNFFKTGVASSSFEQQRPFTIQAPGPNGGVSGSNGGTPTPTTRPTLRQGSSGEDVRYLQQRLQALGYSVSIDGIFGSGTRSIVMQFQRDNGLLADGVVGPQTWHVLEQASPGSTETGTGTGTSTDTGTGAGTSTQRPTLRRGDRGPDVEYLQEQLQGEGYFLSVDGIFGGMTESHVRDFQRSAGLTADGVVGPNTWAALE